MANIIEMPKLSDTMTVGTLVKWLKKEGDAVKSGDMLAEVETDKATMELESFFDGTLLKIFAGEGSQVAIGASLCAIGAPGEAVSAPAAKPVPAAAPAPKAPPAAVPEKIELKARPVAAVPPGGIASPSPAAADSRPGAGHGAPAAPAGRLRISPLARKLAAEKGIDPASLRGSGPGGRIVRADITGAAAAPAASPALPAPKPTGAAIGAKGPIQEERAVPVSNMRAAIARRLLESKTQLPHFYVEHEIDAAPLIALREQLNAALEGEGVKLSVNDFVLRACAEALRRVPAVNAAWDAATTPAQICYFAAAHVSFAVAIDDGLITPVIRDAHLKSVFEISTEVRALARLARDKKLKPDQFTGGTFCVSNLGMMGIPRFSAIINPPNAAILAVGAALKKPVVRNDQIVVGQTMSLTLSCDHRVVDGAVGAQFLGALKLLLEAPALLLI